MVLIFIIIVILSLLTINVCYKYDRLKKRVKEYLSHPSTDGATIRQELRQKLSKMVGD